MPKYTHSAPADSAIVGSFTSATAEPGSTSWHKPTDQPCIDLELRNGEAQRNLLIELLPSEADDIAVKLLRAIVALKGWTSPELVDAAGDLLCAAGWHYSIDGALNPPAPVPETYGYTVQVTAANEVQADALLRDALQALDPEVVAVEVGGEARPDLLDRSEEPA